MTRWEPNGRLGRLEKLAAIVLFFMLGCSVLDNCHASVADDGQSCRRRGRHATRRQSDG